MKIWCTGIVHYSDGVVLVHDEAKKQWRLPERELDETEDILLCIRRCVLTQTGYRAIKIRFYKIQTQAKTAKKGAYIRFIFGCEVGNSPIQTPERATQRFTPNEVIHLATRKECDDSTLLQLVTKYHATINAPEGPNPMPLAG